MPWHRRKFLRITLGSVAAAVSGGPSWSAPVINVVTRTLTVVHGPVSGALIARRGGTMALYGDSRDVPSLTKMVLFSHHRPDVVWAGRMMVRRGAQAVAPESEKDLFTAPTEFWDTYNTNRFHDYGCESSRVLQTSWVLPASFPPDNPIVVPCSSPKKAWS